MPPRRNVINEKEAEIIGGVLEKIGEQIVEANNNLRAKALSESDKILSPEVIYIDDARAEYKMQLEVGIENGGAGRKRESEIVMSANYRRLTLPGTFEAPLNVLSGAIAPAERERDAILRLLSDMTTIQIGRNTPIFSLGDRKFWVHAPDKQTHYVVELASQSVKTITNLQKLNEVLEPLFLFLEGQIAKTYGRN